MGKDANWRYVRVARVLLNLSKVAPNYFGAIDVQGWLVTCDVQD